MYTNIGVKLKTLAIIIVVIGIISSAVYGIIVMVSASFWLGLLIIGGGTLISWLSTLMMYGIGEAVDNSTALLAKYNYLTRNQNTGISSADALHNFIKPQEHSVSPNPPLGPITASDVEARCDTAIQGNCDYCGKTDVKVIYCAVTYKNNTSYKYVCRECFEKTNPPTKN